MCQLVVYVLRRAKNALLRMKTCLGPRAVPSGLVPIFGAYPGLASGAVLCRPSGLGWGGVRLSIRQRRRKLHSAQNPQRTRSQNPRPVSQKPRDKDGAPLVSLSIESVARGYATVFLQPL
jgi:hypothetical protein